MKLPTIGKCKNLPIPKAALVWFFEGWKDGDLGKYGGSAPTNWNWGDYGFSHEIVEIAGGNQCGPATTLNVSKALARSSLWNKEYYRNFYPGLGSANIYTPSEKGKKWFKEYKATPHQSGGGNK